ncbi:hypothetical protein [Clostridium sp. KNHs214]|uniref:hypothetical protein n=1 Tax=Clostridium sp. KNHs214 TaxID=1540257 RepID=UPI0005523AAF|nr:hypothetical protein [Clostridium sp. KNHs214]
MSTLKVTYRELSLGSKYIKKTASELENYASKMERGVSRKISNISGGQSCRTNDAFYETQLKIKELREKGEKFHNYAAQIDNFHNKVKETDKNVAKQIKEATADFANRNGFKIGKVSAFFENLAVNSINSTSLGRWVKTVYNKVENKVNDWKTEIKHWFRTGGGKYVKDIALSILAIGVAVFTIVTAGVGILAILAVVGAVIAISNGVTNIIASGLAYGKNKEDPAWAHRYGKIDKLSDFLRKEGYEEPAAILDITEGVTTIVTSITSIGQLGRKLTDSLGNKGFISIKNLFGNSTDETVGILGNKFMVKGDKKFKVTIKSFYKGSKSIFTDSNFRKAIGENNKLFKDELIDTFKYIKMNTKHSGYVLKDLVKENKYQKLRSKKIISNFIKNDIKNAFKNKGYKIKKEIIPDFSKLDKLNNANMLGIKLKFNSKIGKGFKHAIIGLNKADIVYETGKNIRNGNIFIPNIASFHSNLNKISKSLKDIKIKRYKLVFN